MAFEYLLKNPRPMEEVRKRLGVRRNRGITSDLLDDQAFWKNRPCCFGLALPLMEEAANKKQDKRYGTIPEITRQIHQVALLKTHAHILDARNIGKQTNDLWLLAGSLG